MKILTFSNHDSKQVKKMIEVIFGFSPQVINRSTLAKQSDEGKKCAIFIGVDTFTNSYKNFRSSKVCIVLDNPVMCTVFKDSYPVDTISHKSYEFSTIPVTPDTIKIALNKAKDIDTLSLHETTDSLKQNLLPRMIEATGFSILHPIQTYLYTITDTEERHHHQTEIFRYLLQGKDILKLRNLENKDTKFTKWVRDPKTQATFIAISQAYLEMQENKPKALTAIAEAHGLSEYDLRYILVVLNKNGHEVINQDTLDIYLQKDYT